MIKPEWLPTWISPACSSCGSRSVSAPPATTTGRPTTASISPIRPAARSESRVHHGYRLENAFPFILQNVHRYFLYLAFIPLFFLWLDAWLAVTHYGDFRIGLGGVILFVNAFLLTGYSLSCHSLRHIVGGRLDCFSCSRRATVRRSLWQQITSLNLHHMAWAWVSLISVTAADLYVRLLALGVIADPAIRIQI